MSDQTELELAARVLELARASAGPSADVDVSVNRVALALTRFANSYIHQNVADTTTEVQLRIHSEGRTASASSTLVGADALGEMVERTVAAAKASPADPGWPGLIGPAPVLPSHDVDEAIVDASPADRASRVRDYIEAVGDLTAAGYFRTRYWSSAYANSAGQAVSGACTEAALDAIAKTASLSDGVARQASRRIADIDCAVHGARAAAKARAWDGAVEIEPGAYEVVLEPTAVADVLYCLGNFGFNGKLVNEHQSFLEFGSQQMDGSVTLVDDAVSAVAAGLPFDTEGTPRRRLVLVENGVSRDAAYDRRSAVEAGVAANGYAAAESAVFGMSPGNIRLEPAAGPAPTEVDGPASNSSVLELVARVGRGLLVTDHFYTRCLDPRRVLMTGLTRNGTWLIENGEIVRPVKNMRFTQSYSESLGPGNVLGIGSDAIATPYNYGANSATAPGLHLAAWNFTGGASG
ncbi:TldD/PmbA family protein [Actinospica sp. MGRD01-02]|uniref:TldD/PmbA family protein n=1 Tax=Actinospica acidithermotolerans TaxID=2828514 RepID=A0A941E8M8_9ACTN|nr:metallopeptidase TldD-related protein [Actinospica acidithermotolerans]MBR7827026.1 TldD/PmbA family protein [Actinospica acidithermotolerans]